MPTKYRRFIIALLALPLLMVLTARYQIASRDHPPLAPPTPTPVTPVASPAADGDCNDDNARHGLQLLRAERDHLLGTVNFADAADLYSLNSMDESGEALGRMTLPACLQGARKSLVDAIGSAHATLGRLHGQEISSFELQAAMLAAMKYNLDRAESELARADAGSAPGRPMAGPGIAPDGKTAECTDDGARNRLAQLRRQRDRIAAAVSATDPADRYSLRSMDEAADDLGRLTLPDCMRQARTALAAAVGQAHQVLQHHDGDEGIATFELRDTMRTRMQHDLDAAESEFTRLDAGMTSN